ncbi:MAG TPA: hypothetical protein VI754_15125 [Bacteriovoracaceae bacterium]|nr:hypothetical protein [Bacteriovoracaceae bacterium]
MKLTALLLTTIILLTTSCSHMTIEYTADVKDNSQNYIGKYSLETTHSTGDLPTWCWITGIFYGGACWAYLLMPLPSQKNSIQRNVDTRLDARLGVGNYNLQNIIITRRDWNATSDRELFNGTMPNQSPVIPINNRPATNSQPSTEGFLR